MSRTAMEVTPSNLSFDVIIVGSGFTGLRIASNLVVDGRKIRSSDDDNDNDASIGRDQRWLSIAVLDTRGRVGGRTCSGALAINSNTSDNSRNNHIHNVSTGGTWIGRTHTRMLQLVKDVGMDVEKQYFPSSPHQNSNKEETNKFSRLVSLLSYEPHPLTVNEYHEMDMFIALIDDIVNIVDVSNIESLPYATLYDSMTIEQYIQSRHDIVTSVAVQIELLTFFETVLSCNIYECSFLFAVWYLASSGGIEALGDNTSTSNQYYTLRDCTAGPVTICNIVAGRLERDNGVTLLRNTTVSSIDYTDHNVLVIQATDAYDDCSNDSNNANQSIMLTCQRCVFAMNPALAYTTIHFTPELPPEKKQFNILDGDKSNVLPGHAIKIYLSYKFPFWDDDDDDDHNDTVDGSNVKSSVNTTNNLRLDEIYPAKNIFSSQKVNGHSTIVALITGKTCMSVLGMMKSERKLLLLKQLCNMYPQVETTIINTPVSYLETNWCTDKLLSGGCYTNGYKKFIGVRLALQSPLGGNNNGHNDDDDDDGRIFFASSETADKYCGYMEGALVAGDAVSTLILKSLNK